MHHSPNHGQTLCNPYSKKCTTPATMSRLCETLTVRRYHPNHGQSQAITDRHCTSLHKAKKAFPRCSHNVQHSLLKALTCCKFCQVCVLCIRHCESPRDPPCGHTQGVLTFDKYVVKMPLGGCSIPGHTEN